MQLFRVFSFLWALAILNHQLYDGRLFGFAPESILDYVALWCLLRPSSLWRFAALAAAQLATALYEMPHLSNHWILMAFTNLGILLVLAPELMRRARGGQPPAGNGHPFDRIAPMVRVQLILIYAFATIAKLNGDFLDLEVSCAATQYTWLVRKIPLLPTGDWTGIAAIYGTLAIEGGLAILLIFRRTWVPALILGWGFHLMLGWVQFYDFSLVGAAYYSAFLPESVFEGWRRARQRIPFLDRVCGVAVRVSGWRVAFPLGVVFLIFLAYLPDLSGYPVRYLEAAGNYAGRWLWLGVYGSLGVSMAVALRLGGVRFGPGFPGWWRHPVLLVAPLLVFANGFSPYLGLKTENSWAMFSNLQTEGDRWNHLFAPRAMRIFPFQDDLVRVVESSDPYLAYNPRRPVQLVPFELRRYLKDHPDVEIRYRIDGSVHEARPARSDPWLMQPQPWILEKILLFRPVKPAGRNTCSH